MIFYAVQLLDHQSYVVGSISKIMYITVISPAENLWSTFQLHFLNIAEC